VEEVKWLTLLGLDLAIRRERVGVKEAKEMTGLPVRVTEVEAVEMVPGVWRRTLNYGQQVMIVHFTLEEGAVVPAHRHPQEQVGYVVEGELLMTVGGETHTLRAGQSYLAPSDVEHSATVVKRAIVIDAFSPPREDYK
jgi:quercetin dioxygenase-like cupin family protein